MATCMSLYIQKKCNSTYTATSSVTSIFTLQSIIKAYNDVVTNTNFALETEFYVIIKDMKVGCPAVSSAPIQPVHHFVLHFSCGSSVPIEGSVPAC